MLRGKVTLEFHTRISNIDKILSHPPPANKETRNRKPRTNFTSDWTQRGNLKILFNFMMKSIYTYTFVDRKSRYISNCWKLKWIFKFRWWKKRKWKHFLLFAHDCLTYAKKLSIRKFIENGGNGIEIVEKSKLENFYEITEEWKKKLKLFRDCVSGFD